jgi:prolyl oligopeptidase
MTHLINKFKTVKNPTEAKELYEMNAMQNVKDGVKYPAVINVAGWTDSRVIAWQPANLQRHFKTLVHLTNRF